MRRKFKSVLVLLVGVLLLSVPGIVEAASTSVKKSNGHLNHTWGHKEDKPDQDWYVTKYNEYYIGADIKNGTIKSNETTNYFGWFTHDKKAASTSYRVWFTKGFVITTDKVNETSEGATNDGSKYELWYPDYATTNTKNPNYCGYLAKKYQEKAPIKKGTYDGCKVRHDGESKYDTYLDTAFLFNAHELYRWGALAGAPVDPQTGKMTYYFQPIIGVKYKQSNGTYKVDPNVDLRTLNPWKKYSDYKGSGWAYSNTFYQHYNKLVELNVPGEVNVSYQTIDGQNILLTDGTDPDKSYNVWAGSNFKYKSAGMVESFKGKIDANGDKKIDENDPTYTWLLAGVDVNKGNLDYKIGTHGTLKTNCESGSIAILDKLYSPATADINDIPDTATAKAKWKITTNGKSYNSQFYTFMKDRKFQCTLDTQITYYYVRVPEKVKINFVAAYKFEEGCRYVPVNPDGSIGTTPLEVELNKKVDIKSEGTEDAVYLNTALPSTVSYNGFQWQASSAAFGKVGSTIAAAPSEYVKNEAWASNKSRAQEESFNLLGQTQTGWKNTFDSNNRLQFTPTKINQNYVYVVYYTVAPPQVELYYQKTSTGYQLLEVKSDGKSINKDDVTVDVCKRLHWTDSVSSTVDRIRNYNGNNMVLTEAYPILCDRKVGTPSIKWYNGATSNAWTNNALPTTGANKNKGYKAKDLVTAYKERNKDGGKCTISYKDGDAPYARIFVYVYEAGPTVTVKSAFKEYGKGYYDWFQSDKTFTIGGKEYKGASKYTITYPLEILDSPFIKVTDILAQDCVGEFDSFTEAYTIRCNRHGYTMYEYVKASNKAEVEAIKKFGGGEKSLESYANRSKDFDGVIDLSQGDVAFLKIFEITPETGHWEVDYVDLEDGEGEKEIAPFTFNKKTYQRVGRPTLYLRDYVRGAAMVGDVINYKFMVGISLEGVGRIEGGEYTLVNVGISNKTVETYDDSGYRGDIKDNKKTQHSSKAESEYATETYTNLEANADVDKTNYDDASIKSNASVNDIDDGDILWAVNPYAVDNISDLPDLYNYSNSKLGAVWRLWHAGGWVDKEGGAFTLSEANGYVPFDTTSRWVWRVYKPNKAVSVGSVLVDGDDYTVIEDYKRRDLNVYTPDITIGYPPYITSTSIDNEKGTLVFRKILANVYI